MVGIYKITSPSGKVYVGQSWDILKRWKQYEQQNGIQNQRKLVHSLKKYGFAAHKFEILDWYSAGCNQTVLDRREQLWMDLHRELGLELLNIREAGSRGKQSDETIRRAVATRHSKGSYTASPEAKERCRAQFLGKKQSAATIAKRAATQKGQSRPAIALFNQQRIRTEAEREKQSKSRKAWWAANRDTPRRKPRPYTRSEESRQKYSEIKKAWWAERKRKEQALT